MADRVRRLAEHGQSAYDVVRVSSIAKVLSGSDSEVRGSPTSPKHQIVTEKFRRLGMEFGGVTLLEQTIRQMLDLIHRIDSL